MLTDTTTAGQPGALSCSNGQQATDSRMTAGGAVAVAEFDSADGLLGLLRTVHVVADLAANGLTHLDGCQIEREDMVAMFELLAAKAHEASCKAEHIRRLLTELPEAHHE
jgi:hypothetical protein